MEGKITPPKSFCPDSSLAAHKPAGRGHQVRKPEPFEQKVSKDTKLQPLDVVPETGISPGFGGVFNCITQFCSWVTIAHLADFYFKRSVFVSCVAYSSPISSDTLLARALKNCRLTDGERHVIYRTGHEV
jgi:hypothetical protein